MAYTMKVNGIEELSQMLNALGEQAEEVASRALYKGAGVMANAYNAAAKSIRTEEFRYAFNGMKRDPSPEEKAALEGKTGIARFDKNGTEVNTAVGLSGAGYVTIGGKRKAVRKIANAINSGTSFMQQQPFFRRAVAGATPKATAAIAAKGEEMAEQILNK